MSKISEENDKRARQLAREGRSQGEGLKREADKGVNSWSGWKHHGQFKIGKKEAKSKEKSLKKAEKGSKTKKVVWSTNSFGQRRSFMK